MLEKLRPNVLALSAGALVLSMYLMATDADGAMQVVLLVSGGLLGIAGAVATDGPPPSVPASTHQDVVDGLLEKVPNREFCDPDDAVVPLGRAYAQYQHDGEGNA